MANVLAQLIAECDARLVGLDAEAAQAAQDGVLRAARTVHAKSLDLRRDLEQLQSVEHRIVRRFYRA
jgi:hypothetical protein